jgi:hypothetical protein
LPRYHFDRASSRNGSIGNIAGYCSTKLPGLDAQSTDTQPTESIQNGVRTAQMEAVRRNEPVTFWMVSSLDSNCTLATLSTWNGSWVVGNPSNGLGNNSSSPAGKCDSDNFLQKNAGAGNRSGITVASTNNTNCVAFNGFGQIISQHTTCATPISNITATVDSSNRRLSLTINNGNIRLCDPSRSATDARGCH